MSEPRERLKLRKWLENQIDSKEVPGLRWLDAEHTTFRVLWKHAGKPDFIVDKDAVLFREWARHTNRYQEGDQPDPSTWKTRFRCALNKMPDLKEVKVADSLNGSEPYRVFKFIKSDEKKNGKNCIHFIFILLYNFITPFIFTNYFLIIRLYNFSAATPKGKRCFFLM